jgi:taurine dioxygenase
MSQIEIRPLPEAGGAEVRCGPIQSIDNEVFHKIYDAWLDHLVLVFRDQRITDLEFRDFGRRFGPLKGASIGASGGEPGDAESWPDVHVVSNVTEDGVPIGILGSGDVAWHTDMVSFLVPPKATLLHALEVPFLGGDTLFMNMYVAWETLPDDVKRRIVGLTIKHEVLNESSGSGTGASHPIVCTHPETRCNALFLGARENTSINELSRPESDDVLRSLWAHVIQWRFVWRHEWRPGDVVVWDNRCVAHARQAFEPSARRILHRIQVQGKVRPNTAPNALLRHAHRRPPPMSKVP